MSELREVSKSSPAFPREVDCSIRIFLSKEVVPSLVREVSEGEINDKRTRPSAYSPVIVTEEADEELVDCAAYEETGTAPASSRLHRHKIEIMRFNIKKPPIKKNDKKMKYLLNKANGTKEYIKMSTDNMSKILTPNFIEVYNCIIIDTNNEIKAENIDFERILLTFQDRTGYEASCNEVRLNDYIDCYDEMGLLKTAEIIMKVWEKS